VQKLIAKYGTAVHLALLAVAPLFLFPFFSDSETATVLLWLSLPAFSWAILSPSLRSGEALHNARQRVMKSVRSDPLFWTSLGLVLLTGVRALNGGISLVYDAEVAKWSLSKPVLEILPGSVEGAGRLPFSVMVAVTALLLGCRHSLGPSARMAFLMLSSTFAGMAAVLSILVGANGCEVIRSAITCSEVSSFYVGVAYYLHLLGGTVALLAAFERKWNWMMPLFGLAIGGTAAAGYLFSPVIVTVVFASAEVLLLLYVVIFAMKTLAASGEFKLLVVSGLSLVLGGLLVMTLEPDVTMSRVALIKAMEFLPDSFVSVRKALSDVALRSWLSNLWLGTGLGSFPYAFRFYAETTDWQLVRAGAQSVPNGWWFLLAERGIVGAMIIGLPVGFLVFTYLRRMIGWISWRTYCHPACCLGPLVLAALAVSGMYGCALFRADVMIVAVALLAVSANSFPRGKRKENG